MITQEQFIHLFKQLFPYKESDTLILTEMFSAFDDNQSGDINFVEFLTAISLCGKADPDEKLHLAFKMYDDNRNGRLDNEEILFILKGLCNVTKNPGSELMKWDQENKGYLTEEEFIQYIKSEPNIYKYYMNLIKLHD